MQTAIDKKNYTDNFPNSKFITILAIKILMRPNMYTFKRNNQEKN